MEALTALDSPEPPASEERLYGQRLEARGSRVSTRTSTLGRGTVGHSVST